MPVSAGILLTVSSRLHGRQVCFSRQCLSGQSLFFAPSAEPEQVRPVFPPALAMSGSPEKKKGRIKSRLQE
jgi:hypothetical protein